MVSDYPSFAARLAETVSTGIARGTEAAGFREMFDEIELLVRNHLDRELTPSQRGLVACRPGCPACCVVQVAVLPPEAHVIARFLRDTLSPDDLDAIAARLAELAERLRWVDEEERLRLQIPCAFLDEAGRCRIHPVRPLLCRSITSTDPAACRRALCATSFDEEEPVTMNLVQRFLYVEAFTAVAGGLDRHGLDSRSRELSVAIHGALAVV